MGAAPVCSCVPRIGGRGAPWAPCARRCASARPLLPSMLSSSSETARKRRPLVGTHPPLGRGPAAADRRIIRAMAAVATLTPAERWRLAAHRAGTHSLLVWPPVAVAVLVNASVRKGSLEIDLARAYLPAAHAVVHGHSPYTPLTLSGLARGSEFVYPPTAAWLAAPLAALPLGVAEGIGLALMIGCVVGTLLLLGVRDWRCHMVAFLWLPTYSALQTGNLALPLALGIAAVWRYRDRRVVAGLAA